jgi:hypothetical protein
MALPAVLATGLAGAIVAGLASGAAQITLKVLATLGFGYLTYVGVDMLVSQTSAQVFTLIGNFPPLAKSLIGVLQIGTCMKVMFSAMVLRLSVMGLNEGVIKRMQVVG